ncbi:pyrroline-5-carboxylate reductase family protein [Bosea sp. NBC_00550]|uniref:pyrroline-5-carboxylate reductase family protein n=1 Tax=Bosea sp. NBC_00550 TaxID=2969621 RepID=UPI0022319AA3|nr:pyrroline-5-carboxylate reductase dimerization domain-containing protein [Bosea sp. NBC_00550]UZF93194.1 NAD(P)-binding domain-containing protein [Bosea sp. NBC_00550]
MRDDATKRILVVGTGRLAQAMSPAFVRAWPDYETAVMGRSPEAQNALLAAHPRLAAGSLAFASRCDVAVLAVSPDAYEAVLATLSPHLAAETIVLSVTNAVSLADIGRWTMNPVIKAVPTIAQSVGRGAVPVVTGPRAGAAEMRLVVDWFERFSFPVIVAEEHIRIASNVAGSAIAAFAEIANAFVSANAEHAPGLDRASLETMMAETLIAVGELHRSGRGFEEIIGSIATPGGVTEAMLAPLRAAIDDVCHAMVATSIQKQARLQAAAAGKHGH